MRQWRTKLIEDAYETGSCHDKNLNEAAINVLNVIIDHLNQPKSKPLQRKNALKETDLKGVEFDSTKLINKIKRKKSETRLQKRTVVVDKLDFYELYHYNAGRIAKLKKSGKRQDPHVFKEIQKLREENRILVKKHGECITKKKRN